MNCVRGTRPIAAAVVVFASLLAGACGGGDGSDAAPSDADAPVAPQDQIGSVGDAVEMAAGAPGEASGVACDLDRSMLEIATDAYLALEGVPAVSQQDLLAAELIAEVSPLFVVTADGRVEPAAGSPC